MYNHPVFVKHNHKVPSTNGILQIFSSVLEANLGQFVHKSSTKTQNIYTLNQLVKFSFSSIS